MISSRAESDAKLQPLFGLCKFLTLFLKKIFAVWLLAGFCPALAWLQVHRLRFCECKVSAFFGDGQMFFLFFLVGGFIWGWVHIIYIGIWGWIYLDFGFWVDFGWMKEIKKSASPKKTAPVGVGVGGCVGVGIEGRAQNIAPLQVEKWL